MMSLDTFTQLTESEAGWVNATIMAIIAAARRLSVGMIVFACFSSFSLFNDCHPATSKP